jgi:hypothetical protein
MGQQSVAQGGHAIHSVGYSKRLYNYDLVSLDCKFLRFILLFVCGGCAPVLFLLIRRDHLWVILLAISGGIVDWSTTGELSGLCSLTWHGGRDR